MTRHQLYLSLFFLLPLLYFFSLPISVGDLAIWIAQGRYFLETGSILRHDIFTVLPTSELIYPAGTSIIYAAIYSVSGLATVTLIHKVIILAVAYLWYKSVFTKLKSPWSMSNLAILLFSWLGAITLFVDRPALISMLPFVVSFLILQRDDELEWSDIGKLNLINIAWVNLHGSWLILGLMYFYREVSRWFILKKKFSAQQAIGLVSIACTSLINPFTYKVFAYLFETSRISKERGLDEWAPADMSAYRSQAIAFYVLILAVIGIYVYFWKRDPEKAKRLLASPFMIILLLGLQSIRNTILPFYILIPAAYHLGLMHEGTTAEKAKNRLKSVLNLAIVLVVFGLTVSFSPYLKAKMAFALPPEKREVFDNSAPFEFANYLSTTSDNDPVFNDWDYGSFLSLSQPHRYFIDTRNIIFSRADFQTYLGVVNGRPGWETVLAKYKIRYVLLSKSLRENFIAKLSESSQWRKVLENDDTVLFRLNN